MPAPPDAETQRIVDEFARRDREIPESFYALSNPPNLFLRQGHERAVLGLLREERLLPLEGKRLLDVGCGDGKWLRTFRAFGVQGRDLAGIDLDEVKTRAVAADIPGSDVRGGRADALPWLDARFDLVTQFTVFTSVLDDALQQRIAAEMRRVLAPGGAIVWIDFMYSNPRNKNVRGVTLSRLKSLFPGGRVRARRVSLAPPLARRIVPLSWTGAFLLERLKVFNTHWAAVVRFD